MRTSFRRVLSEWGNRGFLQVALARVMILSGPGNVDVIAAGMSVQSAEIGVLIAVAGCISACGAQAILVPENDHDLNQTPVLHLICTREARGNMWVLSKICCLHYITTQHEFCWIKLSELKIISLKREAHLLCSLVKHLALSTERS